MAREDESSTPAESTATQPSETELAQGAYSTLVLENAEDIRKFRWSLGIAVAFHVTLLMITFPEIYSAPEPVPKEKTIFVVQQVRFKPPVTPPTPERPPRPTKKIPIPDPTPDDPEPLRIDEPELELDLPELADYVIGIPDAPPAIEPEGPIRVGGNVKPPVRVSTPKPQYTELARRVRLEGTVIVEAIINRQGEVTNTRVLKGLSMGLEEEAVKAVKRWKYQPATLNGKPVDVIFTVSVHFFLN
ncbi:MAG: energy transducer TonB [bacterium]|nr:energy transducer TonB [bacterium]